MSTKFGVLDVYGDASSGELGKNAPKGEDLMLKLARTKNHMRIRTYPVHSCYCTLLPACTHSHMYVDAECSTSRFLQLKGHGKWCDSGC